MDNNSGLVKASEKNTVEKSTDYAACCGQPKCICSGYKVGSATAKAGGPENTLEAAFGPPVDEHPAASMFKSLRDS